MKSRYKISSMTYEYRPNTINGLCRLFRDGLDNYGQLIEYLDL